MADEVPAGAWSESASSMVTWGLLLTGLGWRGEAAGCPGSPWGSALPPSPYISPGSLLVPCREVAGFPLLASCFI